MGLQYWIYIKALRGGWNVYPIIPDVSMEWNISSLGMTRWSGHYGEVASYMGDSRITWRNGLSKEVFMTSSQPLYSYDQMELCLVLIFTETVGGS